MGLYLLYILLVKLIANTESRLFLHDILTNYYRLLDVLSTKYIWEIMLLPVVNITYQRKYQRNAKGNCRVLFWNVSRQILIKKPTQMFSTIEYNIGGSDRMQLKGSLFEILRF